MLGTARSSLSRQRFTIGIREFYLGVGFCDGVPPTLLVPSALDDEGFSARSADLSNRRRAASFERRPTYSSPFLLPGVGVSLSDMSWALPC